MDRRGQAHLNYPPDQEAAIGIMIKELEDRSAAARAGLEVGDFIFGVDRTRIHSLKELQQYLRTRQPQAFRIRRGYEDLILYLR